MTAKRILALLVAVMPVFGVLDARQMACTSSTADGGRVHAVFSFLSFTGTASTARRGMYRRTALLNVGIVMFAIARSAILPRP